MPTVALVTGSNQGLGLALVECLCRTLGTSAVVYLTARDAERGAQAVQRLRDKDLSPMLHPLDVTDDASVAALAETIRARHGGIDIVDYLLAAAALEVGASVATSNVRDFPMFPGLQPPY